MRSFAINAAGQTFPFAKARDVINAFRDIQAAEATYPEFFRAFKRRLRMYTGKQVISFYNEEQVVDLLVALGEITFIEEVV